MKIYLLLLLFITTKSIGQNNLDSSFKNKMYSKSLSELKLLRNEFFARQGYLFKNNDLKQHFSQFSWYKGTKSTEEISLTQKDKAKVAFIKKVENEKKLNNTRIETLKLFSKIPDESMDSWEWKQEERKKYLKDCQEVGYLINDDSGYFQKRFKGDNHLVIQVMDGSWELLIIPLQNKNFFILTDDLVGGGHSFQFYKQEAKDFSSLKMENVLPQDWFQNFEPKNKSCEEEGNPFMLDFNILQDKIIVENKYQDECLFQKKLTFIFNKEKIRYEIVE